MRRARYSIVALLIAALGMIVPSQPASAGTVDTAAEARFLTLLNMARAGSGYAPLVLDPLASNVSRAWADHMSAVNSLSHNPSYAQQISNTVTNSWTRLGENVGVGSGADSLHQAFWNSSGHRANMLGDFNRVGIGVVQGGGRMWVTFNFIKGPAIGGSTGISDCTATPGYLLDSYGGLHPVGGASTVGYNGYWPGWDIARDIAFTSTGKGYKLDGFGGLHTVNGAPVLPITGYWNGWDIAISVAVTPDGKGAYILDGFGGIHPAGNAAKPSQTGYWSGWRIARDIQVNPASPSSGYVLDGFGGLHAFGGAPKANITGYWPGGDQARSFAFLPNGTGGYVVDAGGGVWPFAVGSNPLPPALARQTPIERPNAQGVLLKNGVASVVTAAGARLGLGTNCAVSAPWGTWNIIRSAAA